MPLNDAELLSDILRELGFVRADEDGLRCTDCPYESMRGAFAAEQVLCVRRTFAIDQAGWIWVAYDLFDLTPHGFRNLFERPHESNSPYGRT